MSWIIFDGRTHEGGFFFSNNDERISNLVENEFAETDANNIRWHTFNSMAQLLENNLP